MSLPFRRQSLRTAVGAILLLWMLLLGRMQGWENHRTCIDQSLRQGLKTVEAALHACATPRF